MPYLPATVTLRGIWAAGVALAFLVLVALLGVQTARIEGFRVWPVNVEGWKPLAQRMQAERDALIDGQEKAAAAQRAVNDAAQARYQELAERSDNEHERNLEAARTGALRYIAANRLRPASDSGAPSGTDSPASGDSAGISAPVPAGIIVGEADLLACTDLYTYAVSAHDWAASLTPGHE